MTTVSTSELTDQLRERIKSAGPISFREWMKAALYDPADGYYCRVDRKKWGREGDYRTSPERSSLFGATLARYIAKLFENSGSPAAFIIMEVGAGDGRLAASVLESLQCYFPHVFLATRYLIDELSPHAQLLGRKNLLPFADRVSFANLGHTQIDFGIILSNELLDAFPVHRVKMVAGELREFFVDASAEGGFKWKLGAPSTSCLAEYFEKCDIKLGDGQVAEVNLDIEEWLQKVSMSLRSGYLITFDYGARSSELYPESADDPRYFGTLRSFQRHQITDDVLASPGEQDITASINWSFVMDVGEPLGLRVVEFERQDKFLLAAGLLEQLEIESKRYEGEAEKLRLSNAALEMIFPTRMGAHFQVLVQKKN
jgi:SAM-dependent MidA family methyltransferase